LQKLERGDKIKQVKEGNGNDKSRNYQIEDNKTIKENQ
jgi:hypothetical protein